MAYKLTKLPHIRVSAVRMHSASNIQIPNNITDFSLLQPYVKLTPLQLHSASSFHVPSRSINNCFHNGPKVVLSPLKVSVQRNNAVLVHQVNKRHRVHPVIEKCNSKR
jgi:hypothetical protein